MTILIDAILSFILVSSGMIMALGGVCCLLVKSFKINGKARLWICSALMLLPLLYPARLLLPGDSKISIPVPLFQSITSQTRGMTPDGSSVIKESTVSEEAKPQRLTPLPEDREMPSALPVDPVTPAGKTGDGARHIKGMIVAAWGIIFLFFLNRLTHRKQTECLKRITGTAAFLRWAICRREV